MKQHTILTTLPRRQRGQAMVFVSVTTIVVLLALLVMYSVGQLTNQRTKLQNTADAVAYSAALTQARDLNFSAYMNRAMIANQVAVAQIVSITGWARGFDDTYNGSFSSIATTLANLSTLSALWTVPADIYKSIGSGLKSVFDSVGPILVKVLDVVIDALRFASLGYHYGMAATLPQTIDEVLDANDPNASLSTLGYLGAGAGVVQHLLFAKSYDPSGGTDGDNRFANVVDASSDLFYKNRTLPLTFWPTPMLIDPIRLFTPGVGPLIMFNFHSGGSVAHTASGNASQNLKSYGSIDASGTFVIFCITISIFGIPIPIPFPLPPLPAGAGAAGAGTYPSDILMPGSYLTHRNAENTGTDSAAAVDHGGAYINPYTMIPYFIKAGEGPGTNMDSRAGLRPYMEVKGNATNTTSNQANKNASNNNQNTKAPAFFIEVERASNSVATSNSATFRIGGGTGGQLTLEDEAVGGKVRAMAKAEAYFYRPTDLFARGDGKTEYGSLYSPYWQAHLLPNNLLEQAGSIIAPNVLP
ncbi:MAG: hypothetical protein EG825_14475 [Rhodocyclaceae bacterium]|nr:hypothetical protein [Rhodocyclaceae bacterium]